jgi:hypothetical protein
VTWLRQGSAYRPDLIITDVVALCREIRTGTSRRIKLF